MNLAKFVREITVQDNDNNSVLLSIYQHQNNSIFGIDSSFIDQCCDDDTYPVIADPFNNDEKVMLME